MVKIDIGIIGSGITSKLIALALARKNRKVMLFGKPNLKTSTTNLVTFFSKNSIKFLEKIGSKSIIDQSTPIKEISCSKLEYYQKNKKFQIHFKEKNSNNEMGRVLLNSSLEKNLDDLININKSIIINNSPIQSYQYKTSTKKILLNDNKEVLTNLLIITDKNSDLIKENFKKNLLKKELKQTSIVMNVKTKTDGHAYQFFTKKGALAFLPIHDNLASVIWSLDNSTEELNYNLDLISNKIAKIFEPLTGMIEILDIQKYKLNFEYAKRIISNSIILMGDAAHSLHPIAGQGLNLSIKDILALQDKIEKFQYLGYPISNQIVLNEYQDVRQADNAIYTFSTKYLDDLFKNRGLLINTISNLGLSAINKNNFIKNMIIKSATGQ